MWILMYTSVDMGVYTDMYINGSGYDGMDLDTTDEGVIVNVHVGMDMVVVMYLDECECGYGIDASVAMHMVM